MSLTPSRMLPLGTIAPDFTLPDVVSGQSLSLGSLKSLKATVVMFISNHCPYVQHIMPRVLALANLYLQQGVAFIAISSNDIEAYPQDSPEKMAENAKALGFSFPYLFDETQAVAKAYMAACTPDFYLFDGDLVCVYRGRFDGATPGNGIAVTGEDLAQALDQLLAKKPISADQKPSMGCNIKWK